MEEEAPPLPRLQREIWHQIFYRLSIRCVLRCKVVCKEWRCVISDPFFRSKYNPINEPLTLIIFPIGCTNVPALSYEIDGSDHVINVNQQLPVGQPWPLPVYLPPSLVRVLGSYNGLVALLDSRKFEFDFFYLFNPSTKEEKLMRVPHSRCFSCSLSSTLTGLCHDPTSNEYKIVVTLPDSFDPILLVTFKDGNGNEFENDDDNWKIIRSNSAPEEFKRPSTQVVCLLGTTVHGAPHWLCYGTGGPGLILYFDWQAKEYKRVQLPRGVETKDIFCDNEGNWKLETGPAPACGLGALDGKLTVALETEGEGTGCRRELWALNEYGNEDSWTLLCVMKVEEYGPFRLLSWLKDEWVIFAFGDQNTQPRFVIYNVRLGTSRPLLQFDWRKYRAIQDASYSTFQAYMYRSIEKGFTFYLTYMTETASLCIQGLFGYSYFDLPLLS